MPRSALALPEPLDVPTAVTRHVVGHRTVLRVDGEIDIATTPALTGAIDAALEAGALELWIDLTPTHFMDSSGVHALLAGGARARDLNRRFAIICPGGSIRRLFEAAGVSGRLPVYQNRATAHRES